MTPEKPPAPIPEVLSEALPAQSSAEGPVIPDYILLRRIGRGSYGDVWLARGVTGLYRAIKIVWLERFADAGPFEREFNGLREFAAISLMEARQMALLHVGRDDAAGFFYYVMEPADDVESGREIDPDKYIPNTLKEIRARRGRLPADECISLGIELSRALAGLHARNLVHRDIKPSNVILVGGMPKLADIGLVTSTSEACSFVGTEGFVPPEGPGAPTADVYGLGKLLYELATGLDRNDYPRLPENLDQIPDRKALLELNEVIIRACEPVLERRHPNASALLDELLLLQAGRSVRRLRSTERNLRRALRAAAILTLIASVAGVGVMIEKRRAAEETGLRERAEAQLHALSMKTMYSAGLARAQQALALGDLGRARRYLKELAPAPGEPDRRRVEWRTFWDEAQGDPADVLRQEGPAMEKVSFSPDGSLVAAQSTDDQVALWDLKNRRSVRTIAEVHRLAGFSSDGRWLVGSDPTLALQRWSVETGQPDLNPSPGHNRPLAAIGSDQILCFTDGAGDAPNALRLWDFRLNSEALRIPLNPTGSARWDFYRAAVSTDGKKCALSLITGRGYAARWKLQVIDLVSGKSLYEEPGNVSALAFSPDSQRLVCGLVEPDELRLLDLASYTWLWKQKAALGELVALSFSDDGDRLFSGGEDALIRVFDANTGDSRETLRGHEGSIASLAFSRDVGLASVSNAGEVRLWRAPIHSIDNEASGFWTQSRVTNPLCVAFDGTWVAGTVDGRSLRVLDGASLKPIALIPGAIFPVASGLRSQSLFALGEANQFQEWSVGETPRLLSHFQVFDGQATVFCANMSADRGMVAVGNEKGSVQWWDRSSQKLLGQIQAHQGWVLSVFCGSGDAILTTGADLGVRIWNAHDGSLLAQTTSLSIAPYSAISNDRRWVALGLDDGTIEIRSPSTLKLIVRLNTSSAKIRGLTFLDNDRRLIFGGPGGALSYYDTSDWREVVSFLAIRPSLKNLDDVTTSSINYSEDGNLLAAYFADGRIKVWRPHN